MERCAALAACAHPGPTNSANKADPARAKYAKELNAAIADAWKPQLAAAACKNDPDGTRWSYVDRSATISYVVDRTGTILQTKLVHSSGAEYLDAVALQAPRDVHVGKPPDGILGEDGTATFSLKMTVWRALPVAEQTANACDSQ